MAAWSHHHRTITPRSRRRLECPVPPGYPPAGFQERALGPPPSPSGGPWRGSTPPATRRAASRPHGPSGPLRVILGSVALTIAPMRRRHRDSPLRSRGTRVAEFRPRRRPAWLCMARTRRGQPATVIPTAPTGRAIRVVAYRVRRPHRSHNTHSQPGSSSPVTAPSTTPTARCGCWAGSMT